jgi:hypothetical protein
MSERRNITQPATANRRHHMHNDGRLKEFGEWVWFLIGCGAFTALAVAVSWAENLN